MAGLGFGVKIELVVVGVRDVEAAKRFYVDVLGFHEDVDVRPSEGLRVVQVTPPGSGCSIGFGRGAPVYDDARPGALQHLHLVVEDIEAARAELLRRGVEVSQVRDVGGGVRYAGLADPDGNGFVLQEMPWRRGATF